MASLNTLESLAECPVCLEVPRSMAIYACRNGHAICSSCFSRVSECPQGRCTFDDPPRRERILERMIENALNPQPSSPNPPAVGNSAASARCIFCSFSGSVLEVSQHEQRCPSRMVHCPHGMCEETLPEKSILSHFSSKHGPYESGGSAATTNLLFKPDELSKGNLVFPPTVAQFNVGGGETFFVSCGRCPGDKNWYFWAYTMGGPSLADHFLVKMTVGQGANKFEWDSKVFPLDLSRQDVFAHAEAVGFSAKAVFQCMVGNPDVDSRGRGYANALKMGYEIKRKPL